jgi:hypothetical protein
MKRLISLPRWMRSRLASKQKTWTRLLELPASKTMAYFLGLAAPSWGSTFLAVGEYDMRRSTREMSARMMNRTPRYRWTRSVSVLATVGQRGAAAHSSSVASEEEVRRGSGAVADATPHWDPLRTIGTGRRRRWWQESTAAGTGDGGQEEEEWEAVGSRAKEAETR